MEQLIQDMREWHEATFPNRDPLKTAKKVLEEASELHIAVKEDVYQESRKDRQSRPGLLYAGRRISDEIADVMICAMVLSTFFDMDLESVVLERLAVVKERKNQPERDKARGIE
jgi:phosphoribosyl-ATP pyrophosphohydrolase